jgi:carbonic anhydrase/acetyltransferase-like protein (isoleucine patch superfamily)
MPILPYRGVWPQIAEDAFVAPTAVVAGDVTFEAGASVWFGAVVRGDAAPIHIGARTNIQDGCVLHADAGLPCEIGADCTVGHGAIVHGATVGAGTLIGMRVTLLNGAVVGEGCVVAAGTLVPEGKRFAANHLIMGIPGQAVRAVREDEHQRTRDGVAHYQAYAREYAAALAAEAAK